MTVLRMPFGKFRGRPVERVESEYLRWLLRAADLRPELRDAIRCELLDRQASELLARGE